MCARRGLDMLAEGARDWSAGLAAFVGRFAGLFPRVESRRQMRSYVRGLLSEVERRNGWTLAEAAGDVGPERMQRLLNFYAWDTGGVRDELRAAAVEAIGDAERGVLIGDETGFLKNPRGRRGRPSWSWENGDRFGRSAQLGAPRLATPGRVARRRPSGGHADCCHPLCGPVSHGRVGRYVYRPTRFGQFVIGVGWYHGPALSGRYGSGVPIAGYVAQMFRCGM